MIFGPGTLVSFWLRARRNLKQLCPRLKCQQSAKSHKKVSWWKSVLIQFYRVLCFIKAAFWPSKQIFRHLFFVVTFVDKTCGYFHTPFPSVCQDSCTKVGFVLAALVRQRLPMTNKCCALFLLPDLQHIQIRATVKWGHSVEPTDAMVQVKFGRGDFWTFYLSKKASVSDRQVLSRGYAVPERQRKQCALWRLDTQNCWHLLLFGCGRRVAN